MREGLAPPYTSGGLGYVCEKKRCLFRRIHYLWRSELLHVSCPEPSIERAPLSPVAGFWAPTPQCACRCPDLVCLPYDMGWHHRTLWPPYARWTGGRSLAWSACQTSLTRLRRLGTWFFHCHLVWSGARLRRTPLPMPDSGG